MSKASFQVYFHSSDVEFGRMDVRDLAPPLLAIDLLLEETNRVLNGQRAQISVNFPFSGIALVALYGFVWCGVQGAAISLKRLVQITNIYNSERCRKQISYPRIEECLS